MKKRPKLIGFLPARVIPMTTVLAGTIILVSAIGAAVERRWGVGSSSLIFQREALLSDMQLWRAVTYGLVEVNLLELMLSLVLLWLFGGWFERAYGSSRLAAFFLLSTIGAVLLALPVSHLIDVMFDDSGCQGPGPALDAMLVAYAVANPSSMSLAGIGLPVRARTVIFFILGFEVVHGFLDGAAALSVTLGGMAMGYLLATGFWNPAQLLVHLRDLRRRRRHQGLRVVEDRKAHPDS